MNWMAQSTSDWSISANGLPVCTGVSVVESTSTKSEKFKTEVESGTWTQRTKRHVSSLSPTVTSYANVLSVGGTVTVAVPRSSKRTSNESRTTIRLPLLNRPVGTT